MRFPQRIHTSRLELRPFVAADADALTAIYADGQTMAFLGGPRTRRQACDEIASIVAGYELHGLGPRAITLGGELVGRCGVELREVDGERMFELGYLIARAAWGNGYATEAAVATRDAAFAAGIDRLVALIAIGNDGSARVAERLGMRFDRLVTHDGAEVRLFAVTQPPDL